MRQIAVFLFLLHTIFAYTQPLEVVLDEKVLQGELPNGLTYYVRQNGYPKKKAELRLIVKVGSIYEQDDEKGLAHLIEHMVFRGSRHFSDEESIKYLESIGAWYGPDTNAFTSFESTQYELSIPLKKEEALEKSLLILSDFAGYATFLDEPLEIERKVVVNELCQNFSDSSWKLAKKKCDFLVAGSVYEDRFPTGLIEVIQTAPAEKIRDFYRRWYRPDRMAVIAIGDFDPEKVVHLIEALFGEIRCPQEDVQEPPFEIDTSVKPKALIHHDPELTSTTLSLMTLNKNEEDREKIYLEDVKKTLISSFAVQLLNDRLNKLSDLYPAPVVDVQVEEVPLTLYYSTLSIEANLFENRWKEGIKAIYEEMGRASNFGFTPQEWKKFQKQHERGLKSYLKNFDRREHDEFVQDCIDDFLEDSPIWDAQWVTKLCADLMKDLTVEEINANVMPWDDEVHWVVALSTPSQRIIDELSPEYLISSLGLDEKLNLSSSPRQDKKREGQKEAIKEFSHNDALGVTYLTLNNGVKLVLKPCDLEKDLVEIFAQAEGGYASLSSDSVFSAQFSVPYFYNSGLGDLNGSELSNYLETEGIRFYVNIGCNDRSIMVASQDENKKPLFEILHTLFTAPKFDLTSWKRLIDRTEEYKRERLNNPQIAFHDFKWQMNTQNHFLFQPIKMEKVDPAISQEVFERAFGNPSDFVFIVVGDFDIEEMKELVIEHLASLPLKNTKPLHPCSIETLFPSVSLKTEFKLGVLSHCETIVSLPFDYEGAFNHFGNSYYISATKTIFEQRLMEVLRKKMGGTYYVGVEFITPFTPSYENAMLQITFSSPYSEIGKMVQEIFAEIEKMKEELPQEEEVATVCELFRHSQYMSEQSNSYWVSTIYISEFFGAPLEKVLNFEERIASLNPEIVCEVSKWLFSSPYHTILSHVPEDEHTF